MTSRNCSRINVCLYGNLWFLWQLKCSFHEYICEDMKSSSSASISCLHEIVVVTAVIFITFYISLDYRMSELNAFNKFNFTQLSSITATLTHKFLFHYSIIFFNVPPLLPSIHIVCVCLNVYNIHVKPHKTAYNIIICMTADVEQEREKSTLASSWYVIYARQEVSES